MTLLVSCDTVYAKRYAPAFFMSCVKAGQRLHLNIINPDVETDKMQWDMLRVASDLFECSVSVDVSADIVSYTFQRFIVVKELLENKPEMRGYYTVDVDSIILHSLHLPSQWPSDYDLGLWLRPEEGESMRVLASLCYFSAWSLRFLERAHDHFKKLPLNWFADQIALSRAYQDMRGVYNVQDLRKLGQLSWEREDYGKAAIHQGKGPRKNHPFFISKMEELNDEFRKCVEHRAMEAAS